MPSRRVLRNSRMSRRPSSRMSGCSSGPMRSTLRAAPACREGLSEPLSQTLHALRVEVSTGLDRSPREDHTMKHAQLGMLDVSRLGLGAMTMAGTYTTEGHVD